MNSMVERVAIAIFVSEIGGAGWPGELPESAKEHWRKKARAAIEAMREPTPAMMAAMVMNYGCIDPRDPDDDQIRSSAGDVYSAAIDAALP